MGDDRAGAGEGPDADADGTVKDESERGEATKTKDLTKVGRDGFDPNAGTD